MDVCSFEASRRHCLTLPISLIFLKDHLIRPGPPGIIFLLMNSVNGLVTELQCEISSYSQVRPPLKGRGLYRVYSPGSRDHAGHLCILQPRGRRSETTRLCGFPGDSHGGTCWPSLVMNRWEKGVVIELGERDGCGGGLPSRSWTSSWGAQLVHGDLSMGLGCQKDQDTKGIKNNFNQWNQEI